MMKNMSVKKIIIIISAAVLIIGAVIAGIILFGNSSKNKSFRSVQVYDLEGKSTIEREKTGVIEAAEKLFLESNDKVEVFKESFMRLKLDDDKYIRVEENSIFTLVAEGTEENSKTSIELKKGAIVNEIQNKLGKKSSYDVNTPNSVMAVRGTIFRVEVTEDKDGNKNTTVCVFKGTVGSKLKGSDGEVLEDELPVEAGKMVTVIDDSEDCQYSGDPEPINYEEVPTDVLQYLLDIVENGGSIEGVSKKELENIIEEKKTSSNENKNTAGNGNENAPANNSENTSGNNTENKSTATPSPSSGDGNTGGNNQGSLIATTREPIIGGRNPLLTPSETIPTKAPAVDLTKAPTDNPTKAPAVNPTKAPVMISTKAPIISPTKVPIINPTKVPIISPTKVPIINPTKAPIISPTKTPVIETEKPTPTVDPKKQYFKVTFLYNGTVFGCQQVEKGFKAQIPSLAPAETGGWNFNFNQEITSDTIINWK